MHLRRCLEALINPIFIYMKREIFLIVVGIILIAGGIFSLVRYQTLSLPLSKSSGNFSEVLASTTPSLPKFVSIPKSKIYVQVAVGGYKYGKWIIDDNYALYLPNSGKLGEGGNTILYAHSRESLFGNLKKASIGDLVILGDANGKLYSYKVYSMEYIKPHQTEKINTGKNDTVTLFTCDGWFDEKRLVVKAEIIS